MRVLLPAAALVLAAAPASAAPVADPDLALSHSTVAGTHWVRAEVRDGVGPAFGLSVCPVVEGVPDRGRTAFLGVAPLDPQGRGLFELPAPQFPAMAPGTRLLFSARFVTGATDEQTLGVNPPCEEIDWDFHPTAAMPLAAGTPVTDQWQAIGLSVEAQNAVPGHPDVALVFDSANPTGGDTDLATPGPGLGNDEALGSLLIVAENEVDLDGDGLVDDPDDESGGGVLAFEFDEPVRLTAITLVDVDDGHPTELRFFGGIDPVEIISVPNLGDNSVQTIEFDVSPVTRFEVALGGSGGVAGLCATLCPTRVGFDRLTSGVPAPEMVAGRVLGLFAPLGIEFAAQNNFAGHPDKAILFDSSAPTGGDTDLVTPGYGPGNDDPAAPTRGLVLIIAENDDDADQDGLVDEPDDETAGGVLSADFVEEVTFLSATVLDVDVNETSWFELYDAAGVLLATLDLAPLGDNSLQTVGARGGVPNVRRAELHLGGSGAWVDLVYCPELFGSDPRN